MSNATTTRTQGLNIRQPLLALALVTAGLVAGLSLPHLPVFSSLGVTTAGTPAIDLQALPGWANFRAEEWAGAAPARATADQVWANFRAEEWGEAR